MDESEGEHRWQRANRITRGPFASILMQAVPFPALWPFRKKHPSWPHLSDSLSIRLQDNKRFYRYNQWAVSQVLAPEIILPCKTQTLPASLGHIRCIVMILKALGFSKKKRKIGTLQMSRINNSKRKKLVIPHLPVRVVLVVAPSLRGTMTLSYWSPANVL